MTTSFLNRWRIFQRRARDLDDRFGVVAVDVEDRRLDALGDVGRVGAGAGVGGAVVKPIWLLTMMWIVPPVRKPRRSDELERLGDEPLAGEGGVAMHQDAGHLLALGVAALTLLGSHLAEHDRVDRFEMRRVGGERQVHGAAADLAVARGAEVVFDVARAVDVLRDWPSCPGIRRRSRRRACP